MSERMDKAVWMLKDFIPVGNVEKGASEIDFVEKHWTGKLESNLGRSLEKELGDRDESRIMMPYLRLLPSNAKILDGGCGAGEWTVFLSKQGFDVTGLDISEKLISSLNKLFPGLKYMRGDLRQTGLSDASIDVVFSWGAFEHFEVGLAPCMDEARRILKPGGLLLFSVPFANRRQLSQRKEFQGEPVPPGMRFYQWRFTREDIKPCLERSGWEALQIQPIHKEHGLWRMLKADYRIDLSLLPTFQKWCLRFLGLFISDDYVSHMLMVVARKPS